MINLLITLTFEFFKTGLFTIGGGMAAVPFLIEMSEKYGWFSLDDFSTMIAISESTPGPIGINMATYVGYDLLGIIGAIVSTLSLALPSFIIVCIVANFLEKFSEAKIAKQLFVGLKPTIVALIISSCFGLFMSTLFNGDSSAISINILNLIIFIVLVLISNYYKKLHPIILIGLSAIIGIMIL